MLMINKGNIESILNTSIAELCLYLFLLLKPLYLLPSGTLQIGDFFLVISFLFCILEKKKIPFNKKDINFYLFVLFVIFINSVYCIYYFFTAEILHFFKTNLYYIFNLFAVISFRNFSTNKKFQDNICNIFIFNIFFQMISVFLHFGVWYGGSRFMGTYNDPNQFAFAILTTCCMILCITSDYTKKIICIVASMYLIFISGSTGMLGAMMLIIFFSIFRRLIHRPIIFLSVISLFVLSFSFFTSYIEKINLSAFRLENKLNSGNPIESFIYDRNIDLVLNNLEKCLYGVGEGFLTRFEGNSLEVHSTWIGLIFYYGIIPFVYLLLWIIEQLKKIKMTYIPIFVAIIIEAFTLANQRQPSFWILFLLAQACTKEEEKYVD